MISRVEYRKKLQSSSMSVKTKITYPSYRGKENIPPMRLVDGPLSSSHGPSSPVRARRTAAAVGLRRTSTGLGPAAGMTLYDMPLP
ncbi:hypothetical protein FRC00_011353 [Tulasnella sp. 408]|nr:hypothetical protein FRC00_011353 [Tulasnella sp. 408]